MMGVGLMKLYNISNNFIGDDLQDEKIIDIVNHGECVTVVCFENDFNTNNLYVRLVNQNNVNKVVVIGAKSKATFGKKIIFSKNIKASYLKGASETFFSVRTDIDEDVLRPLVELADCAKKLNIKFGIDVDGKNIIGNTYRENIELTVLLKAILSETLKERYSIVYDYICEDLDKKFADNSICQFENDRCIANRKHKDPEKIMGCCYAFKYNGIQFSDIRLCEHMKDRKCDVKCLGCKLFTCEYLRKHGIWFKLKEMSIAKACFSKKQLEILRTTFFVDKEEVINKL